MYRLFVRRDQTSLSYRTGRLEAVGTIPEFLQKPLGYTPTACFHMLLMKELEERHSDCGSLSSDLLYHQLPIGKRKTNGFHRLEDEKIPALRSGYRSCLVEDPEEKKIYRLKGVAADERHTIINNNQETLIIGGQLLREAMLEREYSEKFNALLRENGIDTIMEVLGYYVLPIKAEEKKLATTIMHVLGDTRLDELFYVIEAIYSNIRGKKVKEEFHKEAEKLYEEFGYSLGKLKRLMDTNNIRWSSYSNFSNAHTGNFVVFENASGNLQPGLVDFDGSSDWTVLSKTELDDLQRSEFNNIIKTAMSPEPISIHSIGIDYDQAVFNEQFRKRFVLGFERGHESSEDVRHDIDISALYNLYNFSPMPKKRRKQPVKNRDKKLDKILFEFISKQLYSRSE